MSKAPWVPDCCEIILLDCSCRAGHGASHPVPFLVLTPKSFNDRTSRVIGLPLEDLPGEEIRRGPWQNHEACVEGLSSSARRPKSFNWRNRKAIPYPAKRLRESFLEQACMVLQHIV
jgi:mRNA interferase MazF